jgi:peptidoglycan/LPS O-acetylase OafA/YrhL
LALEIDAFDRAKARHMTSRVPALDGLRGVAILLVMVYHQTLLVGETPVDRFVGFWTLSGWIGVDLFFVLSGFLITGILLDAKGKGHYFRNFYARRVLRIFPLYYAVVAFSLLILPRLPIWNPERLGRISGDEIFYWTYLSNVSIALHSAFRHGILDISWSLAIEEQFYLIWPLLVLVLSHRRLTQLCVALIATALAWRAAMLLAGVPPIAIYVLTPGRLDPLMVGALIALAVRGTFFTRLSRRARPVLLASAGVLVVIAIASGGFDPYAPAMQVAGYTALAVLFGAILVITLTTAPRVLQQPILIAFGKYSYALYLFHLPIRAVIRDRFYGPEQFLTIVGSPLAGQVVFYLLATAAAFVAAWLSWHLYERHFIALKRYFEPRIGQAQSKVAWLARPLSFSVLDFRRRTGS